MLDFIKNMMSFKGNPSSMRVMTIWVVFSFSIAMVIGYGIVLAYYQMLIIEFTFILAGVLCGALGIKGLSKIAENRTPVVPESADQPPVGGPEQLNEEGTQK